jgi:formylglycine-generating enzyme required for sulfatase activity
VVAWFLFNSGGEVHPVGQRQPNAFGLFDMHGNIREWCQDRFEAETYAQHASTVVEDPEGPTSGPSRVQRGGNWNCFPPHCRLDFRYSADPLLKDPANGFRVMVPVDAVRELRPHPR